jgi:RNA ligase
MQLDYNEMVQLCNDKQEFRAKTETVGGVEVTIFSYTVCFSNTFDSELAKEFRGTVFRNDTKECICRPFPKFFNLGERPETQCDQIDWETATFFTKHDGSMATPVLINNKIFWKTKNSFYSDVAKKVQAFWENTRHEGENIFSSRQGLLFSLNKCHFTPIFEYVAPHNRIVLNYETEELKYLGFRDIYTGEFWPYTGLQEDVTHGEIFDLEEVEGFVVHTKDQMFKMKTKWYLDRHKICTEFNPKKVIECTLNGTIDDMIAVIYQLGLPERAVDVEKLRDETQQKLFNVKETTKEYFNCVQYSSSNRKEFAEKVNNLVHPHYRGFMFSLLDNKDITKAINKLVFETVYSTHKGDENVSTNY